MLQLLVYWTASSPRTPAPSRTTWRHDAPIVLKRCRSRRWLSPRHGARPDPCRPACDAGATFRYGVTVTDVARDGDGRVIGVVGREGSGRDFAAGAGIVIGADGLRSVVADRVGAPIERSGRHAAAFIYGYFADVPLDGYEFVFRAGALAGVIPTNDGLPRVRRNQIPATSGGRTPSVRHHVAKATPDIRISCCPVGPSARWHLPRPGRGDEAGRRPWLALVGERRVLKDPSAPTESPTPFATPSSSRERSSRISSEAETQRRRFWSRRDPLAKALLDVTDVPAGQHWSEHEVGSLLRTLNAVMNEEVELLAALDAPPDQPADEATHQRLQPT
jgi:hypothetical protein